MEIERMDHVLKGLDRFSVRPSANGSSISPTKSTLDERRSALRSAAVREYAELLSSIPSDEPCAKCSGSGVMIDPLGFGRPCPECEPRRKAARVQEISGPNADGREAFRSDSESAWRRGQRFQSVRVLCIDEFDKLRETEWLRELETAIIDRRYRDGLAGLVGTGIAMNESPDALPQGISSRLR